MTSTISSHSRAEFVLTAAGSPLTITSTGGVSVPTGYAIYGNASSALTISNSGSITGGVGIGLNGAADLVNNAAFINGNGVGVTLLDGGTVINTGTINGAELEGVALANGGTVVNAGTITGGTGLAVQFTGTQNDQLVIDPGAVFNGSITGGTGINTLELAGTAHGTIALALASQYVGFNQITVDSGANWSLQSNIGAGITINNSGDLTLQQTSLSNAGLIDANGPLYVVASTITNTGTILANSNQRSAAIFLTTGSTLVNSGSINGKYSGVLAQAQASINNSGEISGKNALGVYLSSNDTLTNTGIILKGIEARASGSISIANSGSIGDAGIAIEILNASANVSNTGTINGEAVGVVLDSGGSVSNSGIITGSADYGVYMVGDCFLSNSGTIAGELFGLRFDHGTVINSGTIASFKGSIGQALHFTGGNDRLIIDPGAVFIGTVSGAGGVESLELAASGTSIGTISNIGVQYTNFSYVVVDSGANWQFNGGSFGTGVSVLNHGALSGGGESSTSGTAETGLDAVGATVANDGFISGGNAYGLHGFAGAGVSLTGATFINTGNIYGGYAFGRAGSAEAGAVLDGGTIINAGQITGGELDVTAKGASGTAGAGVVLQAGTLITSGIIAGGLNLSTGAQVDAVELTGAALLVVEAGALFQGTVAAGSGDVLEVSGTSAAALTGIGTSFTGFSTISFATGAAWTIAGDAAGLADQQTIGGFLAGNTIDLTGLVATSETFANGILTLANGSTTLATLNLPENAGITSANFSLHSDNHGGTDITTNAICYASGTRILTPAGEVPVEQLGIGDMVVTRFGGIQKIRWIGKQKYDWRFIRNNAAKIPVRIAAGALGEHMPARALTVSPGHSLLLGEVLILARDLVNGLTITQDFNAQPDTGALEYYQIELDAHDCVIAEGCWAETFADGSGLRAQFHNAAHYAALYPDAPPAAELRLCAARPEHGARFADALLPVIAQATADRTPGRLEGFIESVSDWRVEGWALDASYPALPVVLDIWLDDRLLGTIPARSLPRGDLVQAGRGAGNCAYSFLSPVRLGADQKLRVCRQSDAAELPHISLQARPCAGEQR